MKEYGLDEDVDYAKKDQILKGYEKFEEGIKKDYFRSFYLNLLNPFNYISFGSYSSAYDIEKKS